MSSNHEAELSQYVDSNKPITLILSNGMKLTGVVEWQDDRFINLVGTVEGTERSCTVSKRALICYYDYRESDEGYATIEEI